MTMRVLRDIGVVLGIAAAVFFGGQAIASAHNVSDVKVTCDSVTVYYANFTDGHHDVVIKINDVKYNGSFEGQSGSVTIQIPPDDTPVTVSSYWKDNNGDRGRFGPETFYRHDCKTTSPPPTSSSAPSTTTSAPHTSSSAPSTTTTAPSTTTTAPSSSSEASTTTVAPAVVTTSFAVPTEVPAGVHTVSGSSGSGAALLWAFVGAAALTAGVGSGVIVTRKRRLARQRAH
jgi:hypothetical protein